MKKRLNLAIEEAEHEILVKYCRLTGRSRTDVIRELIRKLESNSKSP